MINTGRRVAQLALILALIATGLLTFPGDYHPVTPGLDPSWMWGLNAFALSGFRFGQDLIFTYGPLGYLLRPLPVGSNLGQGIAFRLAVHATLFGCLTWLLVRFRRPGSVVLFLVGFVALAGFGLEFDYQFLVVIALVFALAIEARVAPALCVAGAACAALLFMKFGTGVSALAMTLTGAGAWWRRWRTVREPMALLGTYLLVIAWLSHAYFGSLSGLLTFLHLSAEIAGGYNDAMSISGPNGPLIGGVLVLVWLGTVTVVLTRHRSHSATVLQLLGVPVLLGFKHAFVRQDWGHEPLFFGIALATAVFALTFAWHTTERWLVGSVALGVVVAFVITGDRRALGSRRHDLGAVLGGERARLNLTALLDWNRTRRGLEDASRAALKGSDALPVGWLDRIGRSPVLVVPWELALCEANQLACVPYPTMQMYSTYTRALDRWTSERLRVHAPDHVVAEVAAIDGRNMVWDCPETWLTLIRGWEVVERSEAALTARLLLRRRNQVRETRETVLSKGRARTDEWSEAPASDSLLRLAISVRERPLGGIRRMLFRAEPVLLEARFTSGRAVTARIVVDTARAGLLLAPFVETAADLSKLVAWHVEGDRVRAIRVTGPGVRWLEPEIDLTWVAVSPRPDLSPVR